ncbi:MAG TPA: DUF1330 domain-containing protein [Acidimicrobiia bacterium]|nr:DUF1330 domain-containing protein [Acidimicrobiia bacterium]
MAKGYVIFTEDVHDPAGMDSYVGKAIGTIVEAGGRPIAFDQKPEVLEGDWHGPQTVILEFESVDAARAWYDSEGYQAIIGERQASADARAVVVAGLE